MTINPYCPPQSTSNESDLPEVPFGWTVCFWLLVIGIAINVGIVASRFTTGSQDGLSFTMPVLALIALAQSFMVFAFRWILFRLILRRRHPGEIRGVAPLVGVAVIFAMVKLIEYQGFQLWSGTGDLMKFLVFLISSIVLMVSMSPKRLSKFQSKGRHPTN